MLFRSVRKVLEENSNLGSLENKTTQETIKLERREFDLWPLIESLMEEIQPLADSQKTRLTNQVPDDLVVFADASLLKRVFQNLLSNAIRYTPGGEIRVGAADESPQAIAPSQIDCWVTDNGAGIPAAMLGNVFDKGTSDPANAEGSGLGLTIVQTFVEAHGGTVNVESKEGEGSTFRLSLPCKSR